MSSLDWIENANKENESHSEVLSYQEYIELFEASPKAQLRTTAHYLLDMLEYFGKNQEGHYNIFEKTHSDSPAVYGQKNTQKEVVENLENFKKEGYNNKFLLLVGPNGSSKSSLVRKLMKGLEDYSKEKEGSIYTFSWIFPIDNYIKGTLGLNPTRHGQELNSYAYLEDKEISAILNSELKDHPLLLIPEKQRQVIIDEMFADDPETLASIQKSYLYRGDISKRNRMIYDALLKNYKGKHEEVLKHIRVERFTISKRYSTGAVTIEPQIHVDARLQQITMDKRLASLPPSLQSLNLFSTQGEVVFANRGVLEFSDLLKRPLDSYKYLLQTMETKNINLGGILTELDIFFIGTSNEVHLAAFKQHPDFNSFKGRFTFIKVPYLLNFQEEEKIYLEQMTGLKSKCGFEPLALKALCLFTVMTRLRSSIAKHFKDTKLAAIATKLSPLEKCLFISKKTAPGHFDSESKQVLRQNYDAIINEFKNENLYEGKFGISPRDIKNIIYQISSEFESVTVMDIVEYLGQLIQKKNEYDFLNMTPQGEYHNPVRFIELVKTYCMDIFDKQLRQSLGMVDDRSYEKYIRRYIEHVNSHLKGEKVKNDITGKYEENDLYFIKEFEANINLKENPEKFRSHLISKLGAYYLDNPKTKIIYKDVLPELVSQLQESFRDEQKKVIEDIAKNIVFYEAENIEKSQNGKTPLSEKDRILINKTIENLKENYGYSADGALNMIKYIIKDRY